MHSYLLHLQSHKCPTLAIYADYELAKFTLSIPFKYRQGKDVVVSLLNSKSQFKGKIYLIFHLEISEDLPISFHGKQLKGLPSSYKIEYALISIFGFQSIS